MLSVAFNGKLSSSPNKRVSGYGFRPSPKSPSATSDIRRAVKRDHGRKEGALK